MLKEAIGDSIWVVLRVPTIAIRMADGDIAARWAAMQNTMAFIGSYGFRGEHIISDFRLGILIQACKSCSNG